MDSEDVDVVVIGAGAVGLAVARAQAMEGRDVLILESQNA
ncbi:MAG: FAD-dependent oxidoreductase, partial [Betaproteobacteria bacterium]